MSLEAADVTLVYSSGSKWYQKYVDTALQKGYIKTGQFDSYDRAITREEMGYIADNILGLYTANRETYYTFIKDINEIPDQYINSAVDAYVSGIITGYDDGTIRGGHTAKRSEACVVIIRMIDESRREPFEESGKTGQVVATKVETQGQSSDKGVDLGMLLSDVKELFGTDYDVLKSQYGFSWYCYISDEYRLDFVGVSYGKVVAYYTNNDYMRVKGADLTWANTQYQQRIKTDNRLSDSGCLEDERQSGVIYEYYYDEKGQLSGVHMWDSDYQTLKINELVLEDMETMLFYLINSTRVKHEVHILAYSEEVAAVSENFSRYLETLTYLTHTDSDGNNSKARMVAAGIPATAGYGENVAKGYKDPFKMHYGLVNSPGHLPNIISEVFEYVGIGITCAPGEDNKFYLTEDYYKAGRMPD